MKIDSRAFQNCTALARVTFLEGLATINVSAFEGSGLAEAMLPEGLTIPSTVTWLGQSFADTYYNRLLCVYYNGTSEQFAAVEVETSTPSCNFVFVDQNNCAHTSPRRWPGFQPPAPTASPPAPTPPTSVPTPSATGPRSSHSCGGPSPDMCRSGN